MKATAWMTFAVTLALAWGAVTQTGFDSPAREVGALTSERQAHVVNAASTLDARQSESFGPLAKLLRTPQSTTDQLSGERSNPMGNRMTNKMGDQL